MTFQGQILNKFSKDVGIVDIDLNRSFFDFSRVSFFSKSEKGGNVKEWIVSSWHICSWGILWPYAS